MGSWRFIIIQTVIVIFWVCLNLVEVIFKPFDPTPSSFESCVLDPGGVRGSADPDVEQPAVCQGRGPDDLESKEVGELHSMTSQIQVITLTQKDLMEDLHAVARHLGVDLHTPDPASS